MAKKVKDKRKLKTLPAMSTVEPFIMVNRNGSCNSFGDSIDCEKIEKYMKEKQEEGMTNISLMHIFIASLIRLISQRPAINRFIRGQRAWTRKSVEISLVIKKEMLLESPDTAIKVVFQPDATLKEVYEKLNSAIEDYRNSPGGDFDNVAGALSKIPSLIFKFVVHLLKTLDYFNLLPKFLEDVSPFHCSFFITSMGSLGIPPIYHHLYDFGTCPIFFAFGAKRRAYELDSEGMVHKKAYIDYKFVLDERICDGYYYASAFRLWKSMLKNPWQLDEVPTVIDDID